MNAGDASASGLAEVQLEVAKKTLEADAALRGLGDVNLIGGAFDRSLGVIGATLGITRDEVLGLLEDSEILDQTDIGIEVEFVVDDANLNQILTRIPQEVLVMIRGTPGRLPFAPDTEPIPEGSSGRGVQIIVNHPVDSDVAGSVAQAANIVSTIPGILHRVE